MLKDYLDERVRRYRLGELFMPTSPEGAVARDVWSILRTGLITKQENGYMCGPITVKLTVMGDRNFYYSVGEVFKKPYGRDIPFREHTLKLILKLAAEDGIVVSRREKQTVAIVDGSHFFIYKDQVVYEFTYTPTSSKNNN